MAAPFTITSVSNYNANPPSDDGAQTAANRVQWSTQKQKLSDPIKAAFDSSETVTSTAFGKILGGAGITTTAVDYTVTASDQGKLVKCTVAGKTITTPDATAVGSPFVFGFLNASSGDVTFDGNGSQTVDGDLNFTVPAGCGLLLNTDGSNWFTFGRDFNNVIEQPQGYLTLTSATPIITGDVSAGTSVFYTPFTGDRAPITTDGASFKMRQFSELTLALVSNHLANTLYDVFLFDNSGVITIGTGPAWNNSTAGSCARGTGGGTTELQRVHGLWTNKNSMTVRNGATTYTVAANQGLYIGTLFIDGSAGQITCHRSYGQNRKWGVWNAFNRMPIMMLAGDSTVSLTMTPTTYPTFEASNANSANKITTLTGLAEEEIDSSFNQYILTAASNRQGYVGIGLNSTTAASGTVGTANAVTGGDLRVTVTASYVSPPSLGINNLQMLQSTAGTSVNQNGTEAFMKMITRYRG